MRLASLRDGRLALLGDGQVETLAYGGGLGDLLAERRRPEELAVVERFDVDEVQLAAPLRPGKIVAIGLNYLDHCREADVEPPTAPLVFSKFPSSVIGPGQEIVVDRQLTDQIDWEVELGVVIGRRMWRVSRKEALDYVFGYSVVNDVSARDLQMTEGQWTRSKSLDSFCPLGPVVVTAEDIPDPQALRLWTKVNGKTMQDSSTSEMVFGVAELLEFCSHSFTLEPGDLLITGTPWGVGFVREPPLLLCAGDEVTVGIEGIGELTNRLVDLGVST